MNNNCVFEETLVSNVQQETLQIYPNILSKQYSQRTSPVLLCDLCSRILGTGSTDSAGMRTPNIEKRKLKENQIGFETTLKKLSSDSNSICDIALILLLHISIQTTYTFSKQLKSQQTHSQINTANSPRP